MQPPGAGRPDGAPQPGPSGRPPTCGVRKGVHAACRYSCRRPPSRSRRWTRRCRASPTTITGTHTLFLVISVVGLLRVVGLVVDGGVKIRAVQRADTLAAEARRAGGQAIRVPLAITREPPSPLLALGRRGRGIPADRRGHRRCGHHYGGRKLCVVVASTAPTVFFGLIGVATLTAQARPPSPSSTASARRPDDPAAPNAVAGPGPPALSRRAARAAEQGKPVGVTAMDSARVGLQAEGRIGRRAR